MDRAAVAALARNWWLVALRGFAAIVFGILTFVMPAISLAVLILLFGAYALVDGMANIVAALRRRHGEQRWWALLVEGLVSIAAGVIAFMWPGLTALALVYLIAGWAIVTGVLEITAAIRLREQIRGEGWLIVSGILSIVFGAFIALAPGAGALALVLYIGAYAIVFGALLVAVAFRLRGLREERPAAMPRAA